VAESEVNKELLTLSEEEQAVLKTLAYFDVFNYPMKPSEIHQFAPISMSPLNVVPCLNYMVNHGLIFQHGNFFSINSDPAVAESRKASSKTTDRSIALAKRFSRFLSRVPFVDGVFAADTNSFELHPDGVELDYFIIAKPSRAWLCQFFIRLYVSLFWFRSSKSFGINHIIDGGQLQLDDKSLMMATKLKMLIPMVNQELYSSFIQANTWTNQFLPNLKQRAKEDAPELSKNFLKSLFEFVGSGSIGTALNQLLKKLGQKTLNSDEMDSNAISKTGIHFIAFNAIHNENEVNELVLNRLASIASTHKTNLNVGELHSAKPLR
jgi:hypothetical protein